MALLEKISEMKDSGMSEAQIVNSLKEEGNSPREIAEALSQLKIKSAVSAENNVEEQMQPSISNQNTAQASDMNQYTQASSGQGQYGQQYEAQQPQYAAQQYTGQQQEQYDQQQYQQGYSQGLDIETVRDIAKQELEEGMKKIASQVDILNKSKSEMSFQMQNMENRLVRIESIIQELQTAIIRKMGEYGEAVSSLSSEIQETQKSFAKVINPIMDQRRGIKQEQAEVKETPKAKPSAKESRVSGKPAGSFEDYFR